MGVNLPRTISSVDLGKFLLLLLLFCFLSVFIIVFFFESSSLSYHIISYHILIQKTLPSPLFFHPSIGGSSKYSNENFED